MVRKAEQVEDLHELARAVKEFADGLKALGEVQPRVERAESAHEEIRRMTESFEQAAEIVEAAVRQTYMTGSQYRNIAALFALVAWDMASGAAEEIGAEQRTGGRRASATTRRGSQRRTR